MTKDTSAKARIEYFDVAKGIAILAVIVGHTAIRFLGVGRGASLTLAACFTFHLPLFFVVSGYFMHPDRTFSWKREARSLVLPYFFTAASVVVGICLSNYLQHDLGSTRQLFTEWTSAAVYGAGAIPPIPIWPQTQRIGAIWFLLARFWARLAITLAHRTPAPWAVVGALFVVGYWSSRRLFLPLDVQSGMCAALFVHLGVLARKHDVLARCARVPWVWPCVAIIWLWAILQYQGFGMAMCDYGATPVWFIRNVAGGIAGTMCIVGLCAALERCGSSWALWKLTSSLGRITLPIMCVHLFEDDVVRWGWVVDFTARAFGVMTLSWLIVLAIRVILDVAIARLLIRLPVVSECLGVSKAAKRIGDVPDQHESQGVEDGGSSSWRGFGWEGKLLLLLVIACVGVATVQALILTANIDMTARAGADVMILTGLSSGDVAEMVTSAVVGVLLCALVICVTWVLRRSNPDLVFFGCLALMFAVQLLWIRALNTSDYMYMDSRSLDLLAKDYLNGTFAEYRNPTLSLAPYLEFYPFQACSTWCLIATYALFGYGNQPAFFVLNAMANCMTSAALYLILKHAYPRRQDLLICYSVLAALCAPLWLSCIFLYPNFIGLAFSMWGLLASVRAMDAEDKGERLAGIIWSFFLLAVGCFCKSTNMLFVLGVVVLWIVHVLRARRFWVLVPVLLCAYFVTQESGLGVIALEHISGIDFGKGMPKSTWIAMGINNEDVKYSFTVRDDKEAESVVAPYRDREGFRFVEDETVGANKPEKVITIFYRGVPGWWREDMYDEFFATGNDYDLQNKKQIANIQRLFLSHLSDPQEALTFFGTKLATEWANPDFMSLYYSAMGDNTIGGMENYLLYQSYPTARVLRVALDGYQSLTYCASLAALLVLLFRRRRLDAALAGLCICFLMGYLCFILWEAKSVYVVSYYLLLLPLVAIGLGSLVGKADAVRASSMPIIDSSDQ